MNKNTNNPYTIDMAIDMQKYPTDWKPKDFLRSASSNLFFVKETIEWLIFLFTVFPANFAIEFEVLEIKTKIALSVIEIKFVKKKKINISNNASSLEFKSRKKEFLKIWYNFFIENNFKSIKKNFFFAILKRYKRFIIWNIIE